MEENKFEWDTTKNKSNLDKHGVDFNQAKEVFKDENKIETPDNRKDYGEQRFKIIGLAIDLILSVIYTMRGTVIRIISARAASKKERDDYYKNI
jgi:uncharacterized DUF497 family protein